ncbi:PREDICTED: O-acyltransferase WSD1-like [Erythranthe guttata]|uniref:O-acyltransferase WSD1-like n=1 Tax=Erythranthe guttata TaxID=4155 RepID=UPI00064D8C2B|nr:PREDICTED: O-acyltransferase WSD1-like [Erythranthe guttata]|eukprot:XP_012851945.1 PREDICTED: O-acyltransferase WSD1-like [Erythranthe guttata]
MSTILMEENEEPASPTARMMQVPGFDICIYAIMGYVTLIDLDLFKSDLGQTLVKHPRFSSLLVAKDKKGGKYSWKQTIVDIEKHVFAPDLDPNMESPDKFVENFISRLSREKLDPTKPVWEMHVLNVKPSYANSTVIFKIDHSIGDGVSLISFILACAKKTSNPESEPAMPSKKPKIKIDRDKINNNIGLLMTMKKLFSSVWIIFLVFYYTLIDLVVFLATILFFKDTKTPIKGAKEVENSPKRFVHRIVDLDDVKLVKNAMNATINDVLR